MKLPKSLSVEGLTNRPLPGDITLGESKAYMMRSSFMQELIAQSRYPSQVRIRLVDRDGKEHPDSMTMRAFRKLPEEDCKIAIDDGGEGGMKVEAKI